LLHEIQSGEYARAWRTEYERGLPWFTATRERERRHAIEEVGSRLRSMMPFLDPVEIRETSPA
jgi:ketol-acid reductoisomerase